MKAIGYIRVSTAEQADSGLGLAAQDDRIRAYCRMRGLDLERIITDAAVSGGKPLAKRPVGQSWSERLSGKRHAPLSF